MKAMKELQFFLFFIFVKASFHLNEMECVFFLNLFVHFVINIEP